MSGIGSAISQGIGGIGDIIASGDYAKEQQLFENDVQFEKESVALQQYAANKQIYTGLGGERAAFGGAGLKTAGTALDVLRNTVQLGNLRKSQIAVQGAINEANFQAEAAGAGAQATTSMFSGAGAILGSGINLGLQLGG